jgi:hypothetical protein
VLLAGDRLPSEIEFTHRLNGGRTVGCEDCKVLAAIKLIEVGVGRRERITRDCREFCVCEPYDTPCGGSDVWRRRSTTTALSGICWTM